MKYLEGSDSFAAFAAPSRTNYSYEVLNCRKQLNRKQADGTIRMGGKTYRTAQPKEDIQFLDDNKTATAFNIEDEDDELA